jgi:TonB family protein
MEPLETLSRTGYGSAELKKCYRKYASMALLSALVLHFSGLGVYWETASFTPEETTVVPEGRVHSGTILPHLSWAPRVATVIGGGSKPTFGIPVPVPPSVVDSERNDQPYKDLRNGDRPSEPGDPGSIEPGVGGGVDSENEPPDPFVPYEKAPEVVKQVQPKYPDLATRAGLEGTVWVKIWVDKEGKAKKAVVQKTDAEIFNQPATEAAMGWVFTPAMMKNGPVSVWVSIPFRFKLQGK